MTTLGRLTPNPAGILGSCTEGGCWSRSGWEPSPRVQPRCLGGPMVGTGMGWSKPRSSPGTSSRHPGCPGRQDLLHPWPGTGRKVPGEGDKVGAGTHHPRVTLRWDPVEAGTESLPGHMNVRVGRSQAPARGLTLKKKKGLFISRSSFFFSLLFCCFYLYFKKSGAKVQKKSVAERQRFRNHSAERTQARNTEHEPNTPHDTAQ